MFGNNDFQDQQAQGAPSNMALPSPDPAPVSGPFDPIAPNPVAPSFDPFSSPAPVAPPIVVSSDVTAPSVPSPEASTPSSSTNSDLLGIKQEALQQLSPLVGHLEQTPEEKFRTTMMMIQASDDQSLVKAAYDAAKEITDEKVRAQALLDVVNEINYFTQQHNSQG